MDDFRQGKADHPENVCNRCGGPNVNWCAPSPLWNYVMRGGTIDGEWQYGELICPMCFVALAREKEIDVSWRFGPASEVDAELQVTLPDGRVWNPETWLWEEPVKSEYKPGDKVQRVLVGGIGSLFKGKIAILVRPDEYEGDWLVRIDESNEEEVWAERCFEPVSIPSNPDQTESTIDLGKDRS